jgi:hypothetical protein
MASANMEELPVKKAATYLPLAIARLLMIAADTTLVEFVDTLANPVARVLKDPHSA